MGPSVSAVVARLLASLAGVYDGTEPVDELTHALLCARGALERDARPALVAAALLHDVGRSPLVQAVSPRLEHEQAGAAYLAPLLGDEVAWLVGQHVAAKAFLVAHEPGYTSLLSQQSAASHERQRARCTSFPHGHRWWPDALVLRRLDDLAKDPSAPRPELEPILAHLSPLLDDTPPAGGIGGDGLDRAARRHPSGAHCSPDGAPGVEEGSDRLPTLPPRSEPHTRPIPAVRHLEV
ncbi:MAG: hypothetical protein M0T71_02785 [Actinomycetota bacterium]|nr:hypothetical protein [Actinomycetota bacterium]